MKALFGVVILYYKLLSWRYFI